MDKVLVMRHEFDGMDWVTEIPKGKLLEFINNYTNEDGEVLLEDLEKSGKIEIEFIPASDFRESCINGVMYGEGCSREEATQRVDEDSLKKEPTC